jgi:glycosyltransferase involved in cell wall biosynthesis
MCLIRIYKLDLKENFMPKVSVIMPCLNTIKYVRKAIDSVLNQSMRALELIIVDADSTDGTREVLGTYADSDKRVTILHSDRRSMGYQYNMGMRVAAGEYLAFAETDDQVCPDAYEALLPLIEENNLDYVKGDFEMFCDFPGFRWNFVYQNLPANKRNLYSQIIRPVIEPQILFSDVGIWDALYNRKFIQKNNIFFNETGGAAFQDLGFRQQTFMLAEKAMYVNHSVYKYRRDNDASSAYQADISKFYADEFEYICKFIQVLPRESLELILPYILTLYFACYHNSVKRYLKMKSTTHTNDFLAVMIEFRELFVSKYKGLSICALTRMGYPRQSILALFLNNFDQYLAFAKMELDNEVRDAAVYVEYLRKRSGIVVFKSGDNGSILCCYAEHKGIDNIVCFCDNDISKQGDVFMGYDVYSPQTAVERYPDAVYMVTPGPENSVKEAIMAQLIELGIPVDRNR